MPTGKNLRTYDRRILASLLLVAIFSLVAACASESSPPTSGELPFDAPTAEAESPPSSPTPVPKLDVEPTSAPAQRAGTGGASDIVSDTPIPVELEMDDATAESAPTDTMPAEVKPSDPAISPTAVAPTETATTSPAITPPDPTEPPLVNTPGPVANTAPDFTLPSVQGSEYTLSQFRGEQPVAVVFYRAYW